MSGCIFFCAKGVVLQNANRSLKFNSFVHKGLLFARPRIFVPQSSSNLTLPLDLRSQIMDREVWRPRFQLLPITRPGRPFCKISPNSPGCPWASLFRVGAGGLLCTAVGTWGAFMQWGSTNLTLPPHLTSETSQQLRFNHGWRVVAKALSEGS